MRLPHEDPDHRRSAGLPIPEHLLRHPAWDAYLQAARGRPHRFKVRVRHYDATSEAVDDVIQLYIHQRYGTSTRPVRELKGFQRIHLGAGESREVTFDLGPDQLRYWSAVTRAWVQDATVVDVFVGGDSTCDLAAVVEITD